MFLTPEELVELTGYNRMADQRKWLTARGWRFEVSAIGRPIVARSYAENILGLSSTKAVSKPTMNLELIRRRA
jgi:hypothetical protein